MCLNPHEPLRPLVIGKRSSPTGKDEWCIASEDCAFGPIGFTRVRDVKPGEMVIVTQDGKLLSRQVGSTKEKDKEADGPEVIHTRSLSHMI